jgi:hypothetical protein
MSYTSDHNPILLVFGTNNDFRDDSHTKNHLKRFENVWIQDPECSQIVQDTWFHETGDTHSKLKTTIDNIHQWGKAKYGNIPIEIKKLQNRIKQIKAGNPTRNNINQIHHLATKLDDLLQKEEQWWAQRAKSNWLQHGDKNSQFFHFKASQRHRKNNINFIIDNQGHNHHQNQNIQEVFHNYFSELFTSSNPTNMHSSLQVVANRVQPHMQDYLSQDFTAAEISYAVHQLRSNAAPGPDGLNAKFFQTYWGTIGGGVTQTALDILNNGGNPKTFNNTHICLIPKHNHPTAPADYRPTALCNVILKIITKTIANRIKTILPEIISPQ